MSVITYICLRLKQGMNGCFHIVNCFNPIADISSPTFRTMKRLFILALFVLPLATAAQYRFYKDSSYSQAFAFLSSPVSVNTGQSWDDPDFTIPIGFSFRLFSDTTDTLYMRSIFGSGGLLTTKPVSATTLNAVGIVALGSDLQDRDTTGSGSRSPIAYAVSGTSPNRIFKLEWKNAGFYNAMDNGEFSDSINFQLWLYEGSNVIEIHVGNGQYVSPNVDLYDGGPGPWIGLFDSVDNNLDGKLNYFLSGTVSAPVLDSFSQLTFFPGVPGMSGNPMAGSVYRFTPVEGSPSGYSCLIKPEDYRVSYFSGKKTIEIEQYDGGNSAFTLLDMHGRVLRQGNIRSGHQELSMAAYAEGIYVLQLSNKDGRFPFKFAR